MKLNLFVVGLNHKTASVELRERVSFGPSKLPDALKALCGYDGIHGGIILSTCNRTEIYMHALSANHARKAVETLFMQSRNLAKKDFAAHLFEHEGIEAVRHLFNVVSSLDSMVIGEAQIAGQVKEAYKASQNCGCTTALLNRVFRQAREVGKRVRCQTGIGSSRISLSTVAVDVARNKFGDLRQRSILIIGSGKMSELAARYLQEQGAVSLMVASRTHAHACSVADSVGGKAHRFEELLNLIGQADIIISSTAAPHYVIVPESLRRVTKPLLILDLALPRDVDPACAEIEGVSLCGLDDLGTIAAMNQRTRQTCAEEALEIVEEEVELLEQWVLQHAVTPTIKQMRFAAEEIRRGEVEHLLRVLDTDLSVSDREALEAATSAIINKLLHAPTIALRESAKNHSNYETVESVRSLFGLMPDEQGELEPIER